MESTDKKTSRSIYNTLEKVKESFRFLKITRSDSSAKNPYKTSRVHISGAEKVWESNPDLVYSISTGLAGVEKDVIEFLKLRDEADSSASDILKEFVNNAKVTKNNYNDFKDQITDIKINRTNLSKANPTQKIELIDRSKLPELAKRVEEVRKQLSNDSSGHKSIMNDYLKVLNDDENAYLRVHGCGSDCKQNGQKLRFTTKDNLAESTVPLANDGVLSRVYTQTSYSELKYIKNFMTHYFMVHDGVSKDKAKTEAKDFAENLLAPYKNNSRGSEVAQKVKPTRNKSSSRGRSVSRSRSRTKSPSSKGSSRNPSPEPPSPKKEVKKTTVGKKFKVPTSTE